ncbi:c-type cytochrome [Noviherbaspirillum sp. L7-7A]|uniref:c-type cytochrome n=1 Tax=Noviherbaspirillum sp. L7-7A TaxID=2850560 RepID=UPI001C2BD891|nr:c-type cytochrome [Noviherbaspirillum sp. L7-7A]MBV0881656.1 c-type cytochrome [Noviherbaspirillum sp. L7-7A]
MSRSLFSRRAGAAAWAAALLLSAHAGQAVAGAEEGRAKAQTCVACHGENGNSTNPAFPSLSGQPKQFIVSALYQFREGKRQNEIMSPMAAKLSNADMNDLAAYYAAQPAPATQHKTALANVEKGRQLSVQNNCVACHAANLMGQQHIPRLAGQHKDYLRAQLASFKASTRGEMDGVMTSAAQALTPDDIDVLADYLAGLPVAAAK